MFFSAYLGTDAGLSSWRETLGLHARWLGLIPQIESRRLDDSRNVSFGWLDHESHEVNGRLKETRDYILASTFSEVEVEEPAQSANLLDGITRNGHSNAIRIGLSVRRGDVHIFVPPTTPEPFYYNRTAQGYVFGNDMRLFRHAETELDEHAVYALFQYGMIPPPLTMYENVYRIPGGHLFRLQSRLHEPICTPFLQPAKPAHQNGTSSNPEMRVQETLDKILARVPTSTGIFFSGGVDSALLAARMVQIGRTDVSLINYSFGNKDQESRLALQIASHLGLKCHQVIHDMQKVSDSLDRMGKDYSFPFGDYATIPANVMVHESLTMLKQSLTVIEGTGADGAFGLAATYPKWRRVYAIPRPLRRQASTAYRQLNLWRYNSKIERLARFVSKSAHMPLGHATVAQNALDGTTYATPPNIRAELEQTIRTNLEALYTGVEPEGQVSFLKLAWCSGKSCAKAFDALRVHGIRPIYPFMETPMVNLSSSLSWEEKCAGGVAKTLLKSLLARNIPHEWVYRQKSGFSPPFPDMLASAPVQDYLHNVVLSKQNPLIDFCRIDKVRHMVDRARLRQSLSVGAYNFLWVLAFTSGWLRQQPR